MVAVPLLGAAAALWGADQLSWGQDNSGYGTGLALVALAGFAGAIAVGGWAKRVVGGIVVVAGLLAAWPAITAEGGGPGRWIALLGAVALVVAGSMVIRFAPRLPTLGARYQSANARPGSGDADKDMWDGLSHGEDPTVSNAEDER